MSGAFTSCRWYFVFIQPIPALDFARKTICIHKEKRIRSVVILSEDRSYKKNGGSGEAPK
jgi:hypothetical protein